MQEYEFTNQLIMPSAYLCSAEPFWQKMVSDSTVILTHFYLLLLVILEYYLETVFHQSITNYPSRIDTHNIRLDTYTVGSLILQKIVSKKNRSIAEKPCFY